MQHRIKTRFSIRLAGYAVTGAAVMGMIAAVSFAGVRPGQPLLRFGGNENPDVLRTVVQPFAHQEDDKRDNPNQGVYAPDSKPYGLSYGDWSTLWWQRIFFIPPADNPNLDTSGADCAGGQAGPVWYLAGTFGGSAKRTCIISSSVSVLIPILTTAFGAGLGDCLSPGWGNAAPCDVNALRAAAAAEEDNPKSLELSLDGIPQLGLSAYRVKPQAPVFSYTLTSTNILSQLFGFPVPAGTYQPVVTDGYWVMFKPLTPGVHFIHAKGVESNGLTVETTYTLIVVGSH